MKICWKNISWLMISWGFIQSKARIFSPKFVWICLRLIISYFMFSSIAANSSRTLELSIFINQTLFLKVNRLLTRNFSTTLHHLTLFYTYKHSYSYIIFAFCHPQTILFLRPYLLKTHIKPLNLKGMVFTQRKIER